MYLNTLSAALTRQFEQTGVMDGLNIAVEANEEAIELTPNDHVNRAIYLNNLGNALTRRFEQTGR